MSSTMVPNLSAQLQITAALAAAARVVLIARVVRCGTQVRPDSGPEVAYLSVVGRRPEMSGAVTRLGPEPGPVVGLE